MLNSEHIQKLTKLGLSAEQILAIIPIMEDACHVTVTLLSQRRSRDRERQREFRAKKAQSIDKQQIKSRDSHVMSQNTIYTKEVSKKESKNTASRLTLDALPTEWKEFCNQKRPDLNAECTFDAFRDWWIAAPGQKGVKMDWFATWRTWVRNQRVETKVNGHAKFDDKPTFRVESLEDKAKRSQILQRYQI